MLRLLRHRSVRRRMPALLSRSVWRAPRFLTRSDGKSVGVPPGVGLGTASRIKSLPPPAFRAQPTVIVGSRGPFGGDATIPRRAGWEDHRRDHCRARWGLANGSPFPLKAASFLVPAAGRRRERGASAARSRAHRSPVLRARPSLPAKPTSGPRPVDARAFGSQKREDGHLDQFGRAKSARARMIIV